MTIEGLHHHFEIPGFEMEIAFLCSWCYLAGLQGDTGRCPASRENHRSCRKGAVWTMSYSCWKSCFSVSTKYSVIWKLPGTLKMEILLAVHCHQVLSFQVRNNEFLHKLLSILPPGSKNERRGLSHNWLTFWEEILGMNLLAGWRSVWQWHSSQAKSWQLCSQLCFWVTITFPAWETSVSLVESKSCQGWQVLGE